MKIYITGLPSGYEVEHLVRLFYPMAPLTLTPPEEGEDCVWAEKKEDSLYAMVREQGQSRDAAAPLPRPVEAGGETVEFTLASLTYDLLRSWTGIRNAILNATGIGIDVAPITPHVLFAAFEKAGLFEKEETAHV